MISVLLWGLILGLLVGFLLTGWFGHRGFPLTLLGTRFAQIQNSSSFDLQFMFKEIQQKTEDLAHKIAQIDLELQHLQAKMHEMEGKISALVPAEGFSAGPARQKKAASLPGKNSLPAAGQPLKVLQCRQEIYRLCQAGLTLQEIARQLKVSQGEVELVLSLREYKE